MVNSIPRVSREDCLFGGLIDSSGRNMLLRSKWKSVENILDNVHRFSKPGELMLDSCAGILATAKECLYLPVHHAVLDVRIRCVVFGCASVAGGSIRRAVFESGL